jgi:putative transcriptional regulator
MLLLKVKVKSKLGEYLKEKGIKKTQMSKLLNVHHSQLHRWCENDKNGFIKAMPSVGVAILISQILGCDVRDIFEIIEYYPNSEDN